MHKFVSLYGIRYKVVSQRGLQYSQKFKVGSWVPNRHCKNVHRFKFGGSVWDHHTYNNYVQVF